MKKKTKRLFFLAGAAGCTMAAAIWLLPGTSAYFTDHESVWNRMVFGHNTSAIDEKFPTPTPVPPGKSVVKRVKIRNEGSVACYIRAALIFSEPIEAIEGLDTENWVKGEDDYYYYKNRFQKAKARRNCLPESALQKKWNRKNLRFRSMRNRCRSRRGIWYFTAIGRHGMLMREVVRHERKTRQDRMCGGKSSDGNQRNVCILPEQC